MQPKKEIKVVVDKKKEGKVGRRGKLSAYASAKWKKKNANESLRESRNIIAEKKRFKTVSIKIEQSTNGERFIPSVGQVLLE